MFKLLGGSPAPVGCITGGKRRTMKKRSMKKRSMKKRSMKKRSMKKRSASKTRRGRLNFVTHKGDKDYNARGHRQVKKRSPYSKKKGGKKRCPKSCSRKCCRRRSNKKRSHRRRH